MKYKSILIFGTMIFLFIVGLATAQLQTKSAKTVDVVLKTSQQNYKLGEPIDLSLRLINSGTQNLAIEDCFSIETSNFEIYIAKQNENYLKFEGNWGASEGVCRKSLEPTAYLETSAKILRNVTVKNSNRINPEIIKSARKGKIPTSYAFSEAGTYSIKASYVAIISGTSIKVESEPIQLAIRELVNEDIEIWNQIKDDENFAYFIEKAEFLIPDYKVEERAAFQKKIEKIISQYPHADFAITLNQKLNEFKINDEKREIQLKKLKGQ